MQQNILKISFPQEDSEPQDRGSRAGTMHASVPNVVEKEQDISKMKSFVEKK